MAAYAAAYARALADVVVSSRLDAASVDGQLQDFADTFRGSSELREIRPARRSTSTGDWRFWTH